MRVPEKCLFVDKKPSTIIYPVLHLAKYCNHHFQQLYGFEKQGSTVNYLPHITSGE